MLTLMVQYLLSPVVFLLTFILPVVFYFVRRRYVWWSIPLAILAELILNWDNFLYYESRGLMIVFTFVQIAVMAIVILLLKAAALKTEK